MSKSKKSKGKGKWDLKKKKKIYSSINYDRTIEIKEKEALAVGQYKFLYGLCMFRDYLFGNCKWLVFSEISLGFPFFFFSFIFILPVYICSMFYFYWNNCYISKNEERWSIDQVRSQKEECAHSLLTRLIETKTSHQS